MPDITVHIMDRFDGYKGRVLDRFDTRWEAEEFIAFGEALAEAFGIEDFELTIQGDEE